MFSKFAKKMGPNTKKTLSTNKYVGQDIVVFHETNPLLLCWKKKVFVTPIVAISIYFL